MSAAAPCLVIGYGNPGRGDDGIGPLLAERLQDWLEAEGLRGIDVLTDIQLNIEHALDIAGRDRVLFIDASADGAAPYALTAVAAVADASYTTHAVSPQGLVEICRRIIKGAVPRAELLAVPGECFDLGAPLSATAAANVEAAWACLKGWCRHAVEARTPAHA